MSVYATARVAAYAAVAGLGLVAALVLAQPAAAIVALAFLPPLILGLARPPRTVVTVEAKLEPDRLTEGHEAELALTVRSARDVDEASLRLELPAELEAVGGARRRLRLVAGQAAELRFGIRPRRFGGFRLESAELEARGPFGLLRGTSRLALHQVLRAYPAEEALRALLRPRQPDLLAGDAVSSFRGEGIEFAEVRPYQAGDPVRRLDWRVSARRGTPYVRDRHQERDRQVVLFLDTFDALGPRDRGTLELEVRAATSLADHHLRRHDRVGCVGFGGVLRWLAPAGGSLQWFQIVDAIIDTTVSASYAWKDLDVIPPRVLPPRALVIALSPLLDDRVCGALVDLRQRGYELAVIEVGIEPFLPHPRRAPEVLAGRLLQLQHAAFRARLRDLGAAVETWTPGHDLQPTLLLLDAQRESLELHRTLA